MKGSDELTVELVRDEAGRRKAVSVLGAVYRKEKRWVRDADTVFPATDLGKPAVAWFLAELGGRPVGVTRVLYDLPLDLYAEYGLELADAGFDVARFVREHRIAEIGRFAVLPRYRRRIRIAAILMRAATTETVDRGFGHLITDVFEGEATSPYEFHKGVLGFRIVATHQHGEIGFEGRRITMLLDLRDAYERYRRQRSWIFRHIASGWNEQSLARLATSTPAGPGTSCSVLP